MQAKPQGHQPSQRPPMQKSPVELGGSQGGAAKDTKPQSLVDHIDGALNFAFDSLFGSGSGAGSSSNTSDQSSTENGSNNLFANALKQESQKSKELEAELSKQKHQAKHKEMQMTEVFDLEKKKSQELIKQIKVELELLIKDIKNVNQDIHTAVFQEEVNPGTYHVNFFTQLRNFLVLMRQRVKESGTWLQMFQGKKHKSKYMQNSAKYGSQYMFGQEGQGLTRQNG